jgi:hypothetical protein
MDPETTEANEQEKQVNWIQKILVTIVMTIPLITIIYLHEGGIKLMTGLANEILGQMAGFVYLVFRA